MGTFFPSTIGSKGCAFNVAIQTPCWNIGPDSVGCISLCSPLLNWSACMYHFLISQIIPISAKRAFWLAMCCFDTCYSLKVSLLSGMISYYGHSLYPCRTQKQPFTPRSSGFFCASVSNLLTLKDPMDVKNIILRPTIQIAGSWQSSVFVPWWTSPDHKVSWAFYDLQARCPLSCFCGDS